MNYVHACVFQAMVLMKKAKIAAGQLNRWVQNYIIEDESPTLKNKGSKWGRSAPSLDSAPVIPPRSFQERVVSACVVNATEKIECTVAFKLFLEKYNVLERRDIFLNYLDVFFRNFFFPDEPTGQNCLLLVIYKNGTRTCAVFYAKDIVFPPSMPVSANLNRQNGNVKIKEAKIVGENGIFMPCTPYVKALAGPADDFYVESSYETTPYHVFRYMSSDHTTMFQYTSHLEITLENGTLVKIPSIDNKEVCLHSFINYKH
jgi:hypothetical protein